MAYDNKNEKALASMILCVKHSQINHVKRYASAAIAWNKLGEIHQAKGPVRKVLLLKKILHLQTNEGLRRLAK